MNGSNLLSRRSVKHYETMRVLVIAVKHPNILSDLKNTINLSKTMDFFRTFVPSQNPDRPSARRGAGPYKQAVSTPAVRTAAVIRQPHKPKQRTTNNNNK